VSKRRAKGEGSVFTRKDGRVVGEWEDTDGRTRYMTSTKMGKREMSAAIRKKLEDRDNGVAFDSENLTVEAYTGRWLESMQDTVGLRTYQRSEETARLHIIPALGKVKLDKITAMQLDGLYRKKLKEGLSPRSVQIIHATAHKMLKQAVRWRMVHENVAEHATPPKTTSREMQPLTREQSQALLRTARKHQPKMYTLHALGMPWESPRARDSENCWRCGVRTLTSEPGRCAYTRPSTTAA
jgi:integrase